MKLRIEVIIDADRETVWREFDNADNMPKWQPTLKSFTHKAGTPGEPGAVSELVYDEGDREVVIIETMTEKRRPHFMAGTYKSNRGTAVIVNHFEVVDANTTRWVMYANHYFKGLMKVMSVFFARSIRKRNTNDMQYFKLFVESKLAGVAE